MPGSQRHGGLPAEGREPARDRTSGDAGRARYGHALLREPPPCMGHEPGGREHDTQGVLRRAVRAGTGQVLYGHERGVGGVRSRGQPPQSLPQISKTEFADGSLVLTLVCFRCAFD